MSQQCTAARLARLGIDNVADSVTASLAAELATVKQVQAGMADMMDDIDAQLLRNELAAEQLRVDLRQKISALDIDQTAFNLNNSSHEVEIHPGIHQADLTSSNPQTWVKFSHRNVEESNTARAASSELVAGVESLLSKACTELLSAWAACNRALKERVGETEETAGLLERSLEATAAELAELEHHTAILSRALQTKQPPLKGD